MPSTKLIEKRQEFEGKQKKLHDILQEAGDNLDMSKITSIKGDNKDKATWIKNANKELEDIGKELDELVALEKTASQDKKRQEAIEKAGGTHLPQPVDKKTLEVKDIGKMFVESDAYKTWIKTKQKDKVLETGIRLKTLFQTAAGWAPETIRTGLMVPFATRPIRVVDIIPFGKTNQTAIVYMEETTFTNAAAEVDEAGAKPEAALALTERSSTVRKIAVWIPVTSEQLEDVDGIESYLTGRLTFMLRQRLDLQLLVGNGVAPNLTGILNTAGIQTFVLAGDRFDAIYQAIKNVRVTGRADPNNVVMHPNDWQQLRLMRTDDGLYILGNPSEPGPSRIWGLPVVETTAETENSVCVGDFANFCQLFEKKGVEIAVSDSHDTYFVYNKLAIRAEIRVAFPVYRPAAFCVITSF